jgi:hypothetical protein
MKEKTISVNGTAIDISKALPLCVGDWIDLEEQRGIKPQDLIEKSNSIAVLSKFAMHVLKKAAPEMDEQAAVRALSINEMMGILRMVNDAEAESVNVPI